MIGMIIVCQQCGHLNPHESFIERFWNQVDKSGDLRSEVGKEKECWEWVGSMGSNGYGRIGASGFSGAIGVNKRGAYIEAHRGAYILANGPIPDGLVVRHKCDNRLCVRPAHLELGTHKDNKLDCMERGRISSTLTANQVREIRLSYPATSALDLSKRYGVNKTTIHDVITYRTWSHIE